MPLADLLVSGDSLLDVHVVCHMAVGCTGELIPEKRADEEVESLQGFEAGEDARSAKISTLPGSRSSNIRRVLHSLFDRP